MAIANSYQLEYQGVFPLLLGDGTDFEIVEIRGLDHLPDVRTSDTERPADHGMFGGTDFAGGRTVEVVLEVTGATEAAFRANVDDLGKATVFRATEAPLSFRLPALGGDRRINCRPRRRALPDDIDYFFRRSPATLQFFAADPRVYADAETVLSVVAATSGGGRTYDRVYPLTYAAGGTGGNLTFTNAGTFESRPVLTISGPCDTPKVESITEGKHLQVNVNVAAGETLVLDLDKRTVLLNGTASRYSSLATGSAWWVLRPGDNQIKFTSASNVGTLEVRGRSAWL